ncbi:MAG: hypothetical protein A2W91_00715 [Bacteroidetes bacterium GWF2_38_335]|nr:MAG: hypothetical protein A2W91_00715 [Bacteroidetes bacterium GWF2_38_335]OFY78354.1 MAG: hypothetical protein A2281_04095 [Bacteroidetes bacterium RIFOXYA12_FULL_38_20]HBS87449.1 hypothetical protein [Bacteroidales bacterium]
MKKLFFVFLIIFLSCSQNDKRSNSSEVEKDSGEKQKADSVSAGTFQKSEIDSAQNISKTNDYFNRIFNEGRLIQSDFSIMLSVGDSLFSEDTEKKMFYFIVFTKALNGTDGAYSEKYGIVAYEFVTTKTEIFCDNFLNSSGLTDADLENWAKIVCGEILIQYENHVERNIDILEARMKQNIKTSEKDKLDIINKFTHKMRVCYEGVKSL